MMTQVTATVVGGMLKPDEKLEIPETTRVNVTIEALPERVEAVAAWESLKAWIATSPMHGLGRRLTRDELHERR
jgi:predicted DNA-binding antitoxin AbrB/MazE fold protein